jgi:hypothetical protein
MSTVYLHKKPEPQAKPPKAPPVRPCTGCRHQQRCSVEHLACRALEIFETLGRQSIAPRFPSKEIAARLTKA